MCLFLETICYRERQFERIDLHNARCNRTRSFFFGPLPYIPLEQFLSVPSHLKDETVKCSITYGTDITGITYSKYTIRPVRSLRLINNDSIDYGFKYADRKILNQLFLLKGECDDILIVKNGTITDTSYANIVFSKDGKWYSPQNPLLSGTRIEFYFANYRVTPAHIRVDDLPLFSEARIVNAMIPIENSYVIPICRISF